MVRKETCPVCKGNRVISVEPRPGAKEWRQCMGCNGTGYLVRIAPGRGLSARY
jgi:DnaJ-class molecular chaperone